MSKVKAKDVPSVLDLFLAYMGSTGNIAMSLRETGETFKSYKSAFDAAAQDVEQNGTSLKNALEKQDIFSEEVISLLNAGSVGGKLETVIPEVSKSLKYMQEVGSGIRGVLIFQGGLLLLMAIAAPYLIHLVSGQVKDPNSSVAIANAYIVQMVDTFPYIEYWYPIALIVSIVGAFVNSAIRMKLVSLFASLPGLKNAIVNFQTGTWCRYMALTTSAGIGLEDSERLLRKSLVPQISEPFEILIKSSASGWSKAFNFESEDPRTRIPRVVLAFIRSGAQTGRLEEQLNLAADYQLVLAKKQFEAMTKIISLLVMLITASGVLALGAQVYGSRL